MQPKGIFDWMNIKWILGVFLLHLDFKIFIGERGDEVEWAFYSITFCNIMWIAS